MRMIRVAQRAGFSLAEVRRLLQVGHRGAGGHASGLMHEIAEGKLTALEALLEQVESVRAWLELARRCDCVPLDACALFTEEALPAGHHPEWSKLLGPLDLNPT